MQAIDLFSGSGGMSVGAAMAGIDVRYAVELDKHAAATFSLNHKSTILLNQDIRKVTSTQFHGLDKKQHKIIFGGPPCQGFSTSNQKNRDKNNENNWLYKEYLRLVGEARPDWVVFENVKGLLETENGFFLDAVLDGFKELGYTTSHFVLNSADFGVPQKRNRLFIVGSLHGIELDKPKPTVKKHRTVKDAIYDLPELDNGDAPDITEYARDAETTYAKAMRKKLVQCGNNVVTLNAPHIVKRYSHIPQGGNWEDIPKRLMGNYTDVSRCHTGIYRRLKEDEPSVVIGNFRKNMLVHPWRDRGLSVREAARLQSIPDWFRFAGSIGFQQQQVGNLVPPLLAKEIFLNIKNIMD
ncbi:MAG: DNA (cytosine-5-)-methyltransferase [Gallionellales bacterium 35-53-114]|jgi:DNA (cytosine-5)-methyltransferase 1|nr:MAG: DNA (cytosine-5-)-methyltransferase [Gallionellales bacterium 35-53-114]OYZ62923.1 MAG: DNA (cytosine-5-)-methyltransferase [Gallionellales bacterium 24-53-125]OZB09695.1 MAG: DNA (cytosine-5-)-methyltransferase [Gallionellales bacterium 39-52-133]HQS57746.1 DNA cytosine methyltransferase [Gallionellaceae bacterium]HQS74199.1 DNA cytosine methyltransferase [Gallionellaceae bacterium]